MSNLVPYQSGQSSIVSRRGRQMARMETERSLRLTQLEAKADFQAAMTDAVTYVGRQAMQNVALLSQLEQQLATTVPMASGRLAAIADVTGMVLSGIVADTARQVGRI